MTNQRTRYPAKEKHCAYCDRTFTKLEHLRRHQRSHTGEKPFKCHKCDRSYARSDVLVRHLQTHPLGDRLEVRNTSIPNVDPAQLTSIPSDLEGGRTGDSRVDGHRRDESSLPNIQPVTSSFGGGPSSLSPNHISPPANHQQPLEQPTLLPSTDSTQTVPYIPQAHSVQLQASIRPDNSAPLHPATPRSWSNARHDILDETTLDYSAVLPSSLAIPSANNDRPGGNVPDRHTRIAREHLSDNQNMDCHLPLQQRIADGMTAAAQVSRGGVREGTSSPRPHDGVLHSSSLQPGTESPSLKQAGWSDAYRPYPFSFEADFGSFDQWSPGMMGYLDFLTPHTPLSIPSLPEDANGGPPLLFSVTQSQRIRDLWRGQRPAAGVRVIRTLWFRVIHHDADNIFSEPHPLPHHRAEILVERDQSSRWSVTEERRKDLIDYCKQLDDASYPETTENFGTSTPLGSLSEGLEDSSTAFSSSIFPTREVLDSSLELFFQRFQLSFIHKATFDAGTAPCPLLLSICLVGLSLLYPERSKAFVLRYLGRLLRACRGELTSKALGLCQPWELLVTLASTLLVVYLALDFLDEIDACQAHMICAQMLHIAEKHGLFAAYAGDDLSTPSYRLSIDSEILWKSWARVESIKRTIIYLLWLDMAYTRLMSTAGVVEMDKVELHLPCDDVLFEAPTFTRFMQAVEHGILITMPRMHIRKFHASAPAALNHISIQTLLGALYLRTAAARQRTSGGAHVYPEACSSKIAVAFAEDSCVKDTITSLLLLPSMYANVLRSKNPLTALLWHHLCIALTADQELLEVASGREGLDSAKAAMVKVVEWSKSVSARRAMLHAAQIFDILSSSRLGESHIVRPDLLLFISALVLSTYLFVSNSRDDGSDLQTFELVQDIDWSVVQGEGIRSTQGTEAPSPPSDTERHSGSVFTARDFIRYGGPITFAGQVQPGGAVGARKILLRYVHLLDDLGKWRESKFSEILRAMGDFVVQEYK